MNNTENDEIKCPYCGSTDIARILYGKPFFSEELQEQLDSGKVRLGGCCINAIEAEDGTMIRTDPEWYCNHCGKGFDVEPRRQNDKTDRQGHLFPWPKV